MAKKSNPVELTAREAATLINAAARARVVTPQQVRRHTEIAEFYIGTGRRIDLIAYTAWLRRGILDGHLLKTKDERGDAERKRAERRRDRDVGEIPAVQNPKRRESCRLDLLKFCKTYNSEIYFSEFSPDHVKLIRKHQRCILNGGLYCEAVFRAFGKTSIAESAAQWAACYGHRAFIPIIGNEKGSAKAILASIRFEFEENDTLAEDFPEICHPVRALEGNQHRASAQLHNGKPTHLEWKTEVMVLPFVPNSPAAGVVLKAYGVTAHIRGMKHKRGDGVVVRPDFALLDDPQTDDSARSFTQCDERERLITGAVLGLSGHTKAMSAVMPGTVIRKGDLIDRFLDHKRHPEWQSDVVPMVKRWPDAHESLWLGKYTELRTQEINDDEGGQAEAHRQATEFYRKNRKKMDAGAVVTWAECKQPDELSALQHAYNLLIDRGEAVFMAEYQNAPLDDFASAEPPLTPADVVKKLNGRPRYSAPMGSTVAVAFIDIGEQSNCHFTTMAFAQYFTGAILDYGAVPVKRTARGGLEAALTTTINDLIDTISGRVYPVEGGGELRLSVVGVDSGWQTRTVYNIARQRAPLVVPTKGQGGELTLRFPRRIPRRDKGHGWYQALTQARDARLLHFNTDYWKSFVAERIRTPVGGHGALTLWGKSERTHNKIAEHITAERPHMQAKKDGEEFLKWKELPGRPNHLGDCVVGCHVLGARAGLILQGEERAQRSRRSMSGASGGASIRLSDKLGRR